MKLAKRFIIPIVVVALGYLLDWGAETGGMTNAASSLGWICAGWIIGGIIIDAIKARRAAKSNAKADPDAGAPTDS